MTEITKLQEQIRHLRRSAGNMRACAGVMPNYQKEDADTLRGFAKEIEAIANELQLIDTGFDAN